MIKKYHKITINSNLFISLLAVLPLMTQKPVKHTNIKNGHYEGCFLKTIWVCFPFLRAFSLVPN